MPPKRVAKKKVESEITVKPVPEEIVGIVETDEELTEKVKAEVFKETAEVVETKKPNPSDMVKVKVVFGTVVIDANQYEVGDYFTVTRARAETIDPKFIQIID